uniref:Uncharacterized protein n=1 Tax=Rose latent virus 1 TaxID=3071804 RepID=A0AA51EWK7_9VIRU|nr:hypothetical protein [Rose latent virus 1]
MVISPFSFSSSLEFRLYVVYLHKATWKKDPEIPVTVFDGTLSTYYACELEGLFSSQFSAERASLGFVQDSNAFFVAIFQPTLSAPTKNRPITGLHLFDKSTGLYSSALFSDFNLPSENLAVTTSTDLPRLQRRARQVAAIGAVVELGETAAEFADHINEVGSTLESIKNAYSSLKDKFQSVFGYEVQANYTPRNDVLLAHPLQWVPVKLFFAFLRRLETLDFFSTSQPTATCRLLRIEGSDTQSGGGDAS